MTMRVNYIGGSMKRMSKEANDFASVVECPTDSVYKIMVFLLYLKPFYSRRLPVLANFCTRLCTRLVDLSFASSAYELFLEEVGAETQTEAFFRRVTDAIEHSVRHHKVLICCVPAFCYNALHTSSFGR